MLRLLPARMHGGVRARPLPSPRTHTAHALPVRPLAQLPAAEFAFSMGLPTAPKLRFLQRAEKQAARKAAARGGVQGGAASEEEEAGEEGSEEEEEEGREQLQAGGGGAVAGDDASDDDDLLVVKQANVFGVEDEAEEEEAVQVPPATAAAPAAARKQRLKIRPGRVSANRVVFDEEGEAVDPLELLAREGLGAG